jgi:hypothetical protein
MLSPAAVDTVGMGPETLLVNRASGSLIFWLGDSKVFCREELSPNAPCYPQKTKSYPQVWCGRWCPWLSLPLYLGDVGA